MCVFEIAQLNKKKLSDLVINWDFAVPGAGVLGGFSMLKLKLSDLVGFVVPLTPAPGLVSGGAARPPPQWTGEALGICLGFPALLPWALGWGGGAGWGGWRADVRCLVLGLCVGDSFHLSLNCKKKDPSSGPHRCFSEGPQGPL